MGVAAIAAIGSLRASIDQGLAENGRRLLGGDISVESGAQPLPDSLSTWFSARGAKVSKIVLLRTLAVAPSGDRMLVELKAVDTAYPLIGDVRTDPKLPLQAALKTGIVADPLILQRLNLHPGEFVRLGDAHEKFLGALIAEPDHVGGTPLLGPRVLMAEAALPETKLIQPGSLVTHEWRIVLPPGASPKDTVAAVRKAFPDTGWRIRDASQATAGLDQAVQQTSLFLTLVGLSALLVGGIGVATGVRAWLEGRARTIATLRCLGAEARTVFAIFGMQIMLLCTAGILAGIFLGAAGVYLGLLFFGGALPLPAVRGIFPGPLLLAASYGLLTAAAFSIYPLGRAAEISGAALFRDVFVSQGRARKMLVGAATLLGALLAGAIVATSADRIFALGFCIAALLTLAVFAAGAWVLMRAAAFIAPPRPAWLSLGIKNLFRPAAVTPLLLVSLGLGLTTLSAVTLVEGNIDAQFLGALPKDAPSFFFLDIQNDQMDSFTKLAGSIPGVTDIKTVPSLRARIVALNGVPAESAHVAPGAQWALRGDRGLTYAAKIPEGSRLAAGDWWPVNYEGPPLISLDADLARGWGLHIGDTLRTNVLGRDIDSRVANLRNIDWRALTINFTLVASPGLLEHAPQMHIATTREPAAEDAALLRRITDALPNVTGIRVADVLEAVADLVGKLAAALAVAGSVTLASGALVLAGAVAAGQRRRMSEAVVLKTLGASRATIRAAWLTEFATIGFCAGLIAAAIGTLASFAVMRFVVHAPWHFLPARLAATTLACICLMLLFGYAGTSAALRTKPASYLRN